jgi:hypothetical protein
MEAAMAVIVALISIICLAAIVYPFPPFSKRLYAVIAFVVSLFVIGALQPSSKSPNATTESHNTQASLSHPSARQVTSSKKLSPKDEYIQQLNKEVPSLEGGFDASKFTDSKDTIIIGVAIFSVWAKLYDEGRQYNLDPKEQRLRKRLKILTLKAQEKDLPIFRRAWAQQLSKALWENNVEVHTVGSKADVIEFVGGIFAANANKKQVNDQMWETFQILRFRQSRYKWYADDDDLTYWTVPSPKDNELAVADGSALRVIAN